MVFGISLGFFALWEREDRISASKVIDALSIKKLRMAKPGEILALTGYPCGGTPPFGFDANFIIDPKVLEKKTVFCGGGSERSLIEISSEEIVRLNRGMVAEVRA